MTEKTRKRLIENDIIRLSYHKTILKIKNRNVIHDCDADRKAIDEAILEMKDFGKSSKKRLLVASCNELCPKTAFLEKLNAELPPDYDVVSLLENDVNISCLNNQKEMNVSDEKFSAIKQFIVPKLFIKNNYRPYEQVETLHETEELLKERSFLNEAAINLYERHFDMRKDYAKYLVIRSYDYLNQVIEALQPNCVMLWNQFFAFHHVFEGVCREREIKCIYSEFGVIPGTYAIESMGQMGESYPAQKYVEFASLSVTEEEIEKADEIWEYIKTNRVNRKKQPKRNISKILNKKLKKGRPTIFVAGQNDYESGMCPYTTHTKSYHSPIFESSDAVVEYLVPLVKKNKWNLIYKMHPLVSRYCLPKHFSRDVIVLNHADINDLIEAADLTITVLSQTGYVALFNEKPVLMLGYTQLRGKGCNYEAFKKEQIESQIKLALENGFTLDQKNNYKRHIAQICRYYVYEDEWFEKKIHYGRSMKDCAFKILEYMNSEN